MKCIVTDCSRFKHGRDYCEMHYRRLKSKGSIGPAGPLRELHNHGLSRHSLYGTWEGMNQRCNNPNNSNYKHYGKRGIKICERWQDFSNFLSDMGEKPEGHTLDRIDIDGDYTPENCKWSSYREQALNRRPYKWRPRILVEDLIRMGIII